VPRATPKSRWGLHEPVGIAQPGIGPLPSQTRDGVDERLIWATDTPIAAGPISPRIRLTPGSENESRGRGSMPIFRQRGDLKRELKHAAREHRPSEHHHRGVEIGREEQRSEDEGQVPTESSERRYGETAPGIEDASGERTREMNRM